MNIYFRKMRLFFGLAVKAQNKWKDFGEKEWKLGKRQTNRALSHVKNEKKCLWWSHCPLPAGGQAPGGRGKTATFTICQQLPAEAVWMQQVKSFKLPGPGTSFAFVLSDNLERLRFLVRHTQRASGWFLSQFISSRVYLKKPRYSCLKPVI